VECADLVLAQAEHAGTRAPKTASGKIQRAKLRCALACSSAPPSRKTERVNQLLGRLP
jgi:hypothetical protein